MTSTYNDVRAVIEGRIGTEMANSPAYEVAYSNTAFTPPTDAPWLSVEVEFGDNTYYTLQAPTTGTNRQSGLLVVNIFSDVGTGAAAAFTIAERVKDLFDRKTVSSVIFDAASGPRQIASGLSDSFFQVQVSVSFDAYLS
jgi:hypothetical protein|tara:strand:- start:292 stop:711 length:420 start_codon:yes stop_codon:yes gene_type:complete